MSRQGKKEEKEKEKEGEEKTERGRIYNRGLSHLERPRWLWVWWDPKGRHGTVESPLQRLGWRSVAQ